MLNPIKPMCRRAILLALLLAMGAVHAESVSGVVVGVHDGDTLTVRTDDQQTVKVRLANIDAPELKQAYGEASKRGLSQAAFGRPVTVNFTQQDRYGRLIGHVLVDGQDVNLEQVRSGLAWVYRQYSHDPVFIQAEQTARADRLGLWHDPNPIAPWEFRHTEHSR